MVIYRTSSLIIVVDDTRLFGQRLWVAVQPNLGAWATGDGSFVILGLTEIFINDDNHVYQNLRTQYKLLKMKAMENKGTKLILEKITEGVDIAVLEAPYTKRIEAAEAAESGNGSE
jgi:hypothetical protein